MSESVELAPGVITALRALRDVGEVPLRCNKGPIRTAIAAAARALDEDTLGSKVRPWHLSALRRRAAELGAVTGAVAVHLEEAVLVAELLPGRERIVLCGDGDHWRLVRFLDDAEDTTAVRLSPEIITEVTLPGSGPDAVLSVLGVAKPDGLELDTERAGDQTVNRYLFTDGDRAVLAEESAGLLRGVLIENGRGLLLTGGRDHAVLVSG